MAERFVIFSLPRSRSVWLSHFLSHEAKVGHDIGIECNTPDDFVRALGPGMLKGTCETGAMFAWPLFRREMPDAAFVTIRRDVKDVVASLEAIGLDGLAGEMLERERWLKEISAAPGVTTIGYSDLDKPPVLEWLYETLIGKPLDPSWLHRMMAVNVQLVMQARVQRLREREPAIAELKAQVRKRIEWLH
jgi:hypothetical protein